MYSLGDPKKINELHPFLYFKQDIEIVDEKDFNKTSYLAEKHYLYCMETNMDIDGYEVKDNKISYIIGPNSILGVCDDIWMSRFILKKICKNENIKFALNGNLTLNYSDNKTKKDDGLNVINDYLKKLGLINSKGKIKNENIFIPSQTITLKKGNFEDRRSDSNVDPYSLLLNLVKDIYKN